MYDRNLQNHLYFTAPDFLKNESIILTTNNFIKHQNTWPLAHKKG